MKTFLQILFFFQLVSRTIFPQWFWQNPLPQGNTLSGVHFVDDNVGWIVGNKGYILKTTDGGGTWSVQNGNTFAELNAVQFLNANVGYAVGDSGVILKTTNGGNSWNKLTSSYNYWISSLHFINENYGWLGAGNYILATTNGGSNWTSYYQGAPYGIYDVYFLNQTTGFWVGFGGVNKTTDGGQSFDYLWDVPNSYSWDEIEFINSSTGWIVGDGGKVAKTTDGGTTWIEVGGITGSGDGIFKDENNGWIANYHGIYRTQNGGSSWTLTPIRNMMDVFFTPIAGYAVGAGGKIFKTTNLGDSWLPSYQNLAQDRRISSIFFNDPSVGFAVGDSGKILKTENGGGSWITQTSLSNTNLTSVFFTDVNTGWITGYNVILKTTNSGNSWRLKYTGNYENLNNTFFLNSQTGWVVGDNIRKTEDGGNTWAEQTISSVYGDYYLKGVFFVDANNGFVIGPSGWLFKTTNGGNDWNKVVTPTTVNLNKIKFLDNMTGWIVGEQGTILKTTNGGVNWDILNFGQNYSLLDFQIIDAQSLWAIGGTIYSDYGSITLYTTDGGDTWNKIENPNTQCLYQTFFIDKNSGWAVGEEGSMIAFEGSVPIPQAPTNLIVTSLDDRIKLEWSDNSVNEDAFEIFRSDNYSGNYKKVAEVSSNSVDYVDSSMSTLAVFWYRVRASNVNGASALCREDSAQTYVLSSVEQMIDIFPSSYSLYQNYPNPFNPTTTIEFGIMEKRNVRLSVFNILGEEIKVVLNEEKEAGYHSIDFNASDLPSGVYFYRLQAGNFIETKKMILLR